MATKSDTSSQNSSESNITVSIHTYKNPYFNFLYEFRKLPENKNVSMKQIFIQGGKKWKSLSRDERIPYIQAAELVKRNAKAGYADKGRDSSKVTSRNAKTSRKQVIKNYARSKSRKVGNSAPSVDFREDSQVKRERSPISTITSSLKEEMPSQLAEDPVPDQHTSSGEKSDSFEDCD